MLNLTQKGLFWIIFTTETDFNFLYSIIFNVLPPAAKILEIEIR